MVENSGDWIEVNSTQAEENSMYTWTGQENETARFSDHWYKKHPKTFTKDSSKDLPMQTVYIEYVELLSNPRENKNQHMTFNPRTQGFDSLSLIHI